MRTLLSVFCLLLLPATAALAQSGKIAGTVTDAQTGETLPGVNVVIDGTMQGAVTDLDGYYVILNVKPGNYALRASYIGYTPQRVEGVRVNIDQTSTLDFGLRQEVIEGEEIVVTAERKVVRADVSASQANITAEEVKNLPVSSVTGAVGLQAGIQGLSIRGSSSDEVSFMLNGLSLRNERSNAPFTSISLAAVDEVQVQTGGFNAEYGNVRSGVVNVVTKEGGRSRYGGDVIFRYSAPAAKHFGPAANDPDSYWIRPYIDPDVAFTGTTSGAWDRALRVQYPEFKGWIAVSEELLADEDPTNDLAPEALRDAFLWQHRKVLDITEPDYTMDVGFGGPVPGLNRFGDTRFYASYRRDQDMYMIPLSRDRALDQSGSLKLTTDLRPGMRLSVEGLYGELTGTSTSSSGQPGMFTSAYGIANAMDRVSYIDTRVFANDYWAPTRVENFMLGAKFTHTLNARTYYELRMTRFASTYDTNPGRVRDTSAVVNIGGTAFDEAPFGFFPDPTFGVGGMRMSVGMSTARDTSRVVAWNFKGDLTSQLNRYLQVKTGLEYNLNESNINYGQFDQYLPSNNSIVTWDRNPMRGAVYGQGKLEFQGMIANLGLRLDYSHAGGTWYDYDTFTPAFSAKFASRLDTVLTERSTDHVFSLSPRLGVSFPITETSKLFFNYGHFRSMPDPDDLYLLRYFGPTNRINRVANPNNPLPKTVAYEGGFEQALFNQLLLRVAGYYKDISLEPRLVNYTSRDGQTDYFRSEPNQYKDIRGFELTLARNVGRWVQGFVNYTYMVGSTGFFGVRRFNENPTVQREFENSDQERRNALSRPVPEPYARLNVDLLVPDGFGPALAGFRPLADWRVSLLGRWQAGGYLTWTGGGEIPGVRNNVQNRDYWNWDLRFKRNLDLAGTDVQLFVDIFNVFNQKRLSFDGANQAVGFVDGNDYNAYMRSLHLPASPNYPNIPGNDRPGDYRPSDVPYQPLEGLQDRSAFETSARRPDPSTIYYEYASKTYLVYRDGAWQQADPARIEQMLDDKAYIDNPNLTYQTFLNPRDIFLGVRFTF